jgi:hypothetical protein
MVRVFENRVLGKIFGPKSDKVKGEWRKLHNEELNDLYSSPDLADQIKKNELDKQVAHMGGEERCMGGNVKERGHFEDQGIDERNLNLQHSIGEVGAA